MPKTSVLLLVLLSYPEIPIGSPGQVEVEFALIFFYFLVTSTYLQLSLYHLLERVIFWEGGGGY